MDTPRRKRSPKRSRGAPQARQTTSDGDSLKRDSCTHPFLEAQLEVTCVYLKIPNADNRSDDATLRQRQRDELAGILTSRDRDDDVLLPVLQVRHWSVADAGRQFHLPCDRAGLFVERAELPAAPWTARRQADTAVAPFAHEHETFRHER